MLKAIQNNLNHFQVLPGNVLLYKTLDHERSIITLDDGEVVDCSPIPKADIVNYLEENGRTDDKTGVRSSAVRFENMIVQISTVFNQPDSFFIRVMKSN